MTKKKDKPKKEKAEPVRSKSGASPLPFEETEDNDREIRAELLGGIPPPIAPSLEDLIQEFRPKPDDARPHVSKKSAFLHALVATAGSMTRAAQAVGISRQRVWIWRETDKKFKDAYDLAMERAVDVLEDEGRRRAFEGTRKGVYFEGALCDVELVYSDAIWLAMMRAKREAYRRTTVAGTGKDGAIPISLILPEHLRNATDEQLHAAAERLSRAIGDARSVLEGTGEHPEGDPVPADPQN